MKFRPTLTLEYLSNNIRRITERRFYNKNPAFKNFDFQNVNIQKVSML